jgi:hypothetical protein
LWSLSDDLGNLPCVRSLLSVAFSFLVATDDEVDLSFGVLERAIGIARFRWWWRRRLLAMVVIVVVVVTLVITVLKDR